MKKESAITCRVQLKLAVKIYTMNHQRGSGGGGAPLFPIESNQELIRERERERESQSQSQSQCIFRALNKRPRADKLQRDAFKLNKLNRRYRRTQVATAKRRKEKHADRPSLGSLDQVRQWLKFLKAIRIRIKSCIPRS